MARSIGVATSLGEKEEEEEEEEEEEAMTYVGRMSTLTTWYCMRTLTEEDGGPR